MHTIVTPILKLGHTYISSWWSRNDIYTTHPHRKGVWSDGERSRKSARHDGLSHPYPHSPTSHIQASLKVYNDISILTPHKHNSRISPSSLATCSWINQRDTSTQPLSGAPNYIHVVSSNKRDVFGIYLLPPLFLLWSPNTRRSQWRHQPDSLARHMHQTSRCTLWIQLYEIKTVKTRHSIP